jgi:hypothetical protein
MGDIGNFNYALIGTGFYLKQSISYYYALYFNKFKHKKLHNSEKEALRIQKLSAAILIKRMVLIFLIIRTRRYQMGQSQHRKQNDSFRVCSDACNHGKQKCR